MRPILLFSALTLAVAMSAPASAQLFGNQDQANQAQQMEAQLNLRINQLEGQIRQLNGTVEQYENRIRVMEEQQKRFKDDVEFRFKDLEAAKSTSNNGAGGASVPKKPVDAAITNTPAITTPTNITPQVADPNASAALNAMAANAPSRTAPPSGSPQDAFDLSYGYMLRGDYELAQFGFRDFLKAYPQDKNAANAQYYLGEAQYNRKQYKEAADSFLKAYQEHPTSAKAADSLFKLGQSLKALGAKNEACGTFAEVNKKYPRASNSLKQKVSAELKAAGC